MFVTVSLWIDQLFNGAIGQLASLGTLYKVTSTITLVVSFQYSSAPMMLTPYSASDPMVDACRLGFCLE